MVRELDLAVKVLKSCGLAKAEELVPRWIRRMELVFEFVTEGTRRYTKSPGNEVLTNLNAGYGG
jgi:hypothetical protein